MCFEWDERYRREEASRKSKEKVDELIKSAEDAVKVNRVYNAFKSYVNQPGDHKEKVLS
jgi:hypothetical protein